MGKKILVVDTCVLRYALEAEYEHESDVNEKQEIGEKLVKFIKQKDVVVVYNSETVKEYSRNIESIKSAIRRKLRINPSFSLLRMLNKRRRKVPDEEFEFEFEGEPVGRKDIHLINSAKSGALKYGVSEALVISVAEDVCRGKAAKNGKGVRITILDLTQP